MLFRSRTSPEAAGFVDHLGRLMAQYATMYFRANPVQQEKVRPFLPPGRTEADIYRQPRASGGRASIDHGAEADKLIALADKAKKAHNSTTEPLLDQPDEMITKALAIADKAI